MVTLPVGPLPHKEVLGLYIRAWLSKITAVLLPWLSGAMTFQRIWNRLQLVRFKVETFTTAVVIEPVIVCNSGRSSFQHVPTVRFVDDLFFLLVTVDDFSYAYCILLWVVMNSGALAEIPARVQCHAWCALSLSGKGGRRWHGDSFDFSTFDVRSEVADIWAVNGFVKHVSDFCATKELQTPAELRPEFGAVRSERYSNCFHQL